MRTNPGKKGSIALETAVVLPLFLFLAAAILQYLPAAESVSHLRDAAGNAAAETALLMTAVEMAGAGDAAESWFLEQTDDAMVAERLRDFGTRLLFEVFFEERMAHWMAEDGERSAASRLVDDISVCLESTLSGGELYARVEYRMPLLWRSAEGSLDVLIPFFPPRGSSPQGGTGENDPVWQMDNFSRGRIFRTRNGGNLPIGYPVIASFRDGVATSIRSMDITAPSLIEEGKVWAELRDEIDALRAFEGTDKPWGKDSIEIHGEEIRRRVLLLILPENPVVDIIQEQLDQAVGYAAIHDVEMSILRQGVSCRYE